MRKLLLFATALCFFSTFSYAQLNQCVPDPIYKDSTFGVYPKPKSANNPNGGINKSACIGKPFQFSLTGVVPDSLEVTFFGAKVELKLDSIVLDKKNPKTVQGLPSGIAWDCNGGNCKFLPKTQRCIVMYGTADNTNTAKDYPLKITLKAYVQTFLGPQAVDVNYPDANLAPGEYTLKLEPNASKTCFAVGNEDQLDNVDKINFYPNPTNSDAVISFSAKEADNYTFMVTDMSGKMVQTRPINVTEGWNEVLFDGATLPTGMYIYYIGNEKGRVANRFTITR
jgi:Secretion system C-terminal sorting domain